MADEGAARRWLLLVLVAVWGLRLAWHIRRRAVGHGEDPRYEELLGGPVREVGFAVAVRKVFLVQGVAIWFVSLPVQVGARAGRAVVAGGRRPASLVWLVGLVFEAVGDAQLAAYKPTPTAARSWTAACGAGPGTPTTSATPASGGASGWSAASRPAGCPALLTVAAPLAMTYFLVFATGARLLERTMMQRPGYPEYAARTSMFFPRPPKRG